MTFPLLHFSKDVKLIIVHANNITAVRDQISNCIPSLNIKEQRFAILNAPYSRACKYFSLKSPTALVC